MNKIEDFADFPHKENQILFFLKIQKIYTHNDINNIRINKFPYENAQ